MCHSNNKLSQCCCWILYLFLYIRKNMPDPTLQYKCLKKWKKHCCDFVLRLMIMTQVNFERLPQYPTVLIASCWAFFVVTHHLIIYCTGPQRSVRFPLCAVIFPQRAHFSNNQCAKRWQVNGAPWESYVFICDCSFGPFLTTGYSEMLLYTAQSIFMWH